MKAQTSSSCNLKSTPAFAASSPTTTKKNKDNNTAYDSKAPVSTLSGAIRVQKSNHEIPTNCIYVAGIGHALGTSREVIARIFSRFGPLTDLSTNDSFADGLYLPVDTRYCYVLYEDESSSIEAVKSLGFGQTIPIPELDSIRLFLRYATILQSRGLPEPDCSSTTDHVKVEGVHVIPDFLSEEEEKSFLETTGHESGPWLDTMTRRIQHYGVIFNYETLMLDYSTDTPPIPESVQPWVDRIGGKLAEIYQDFPLTGASSLQVSNLQASSSDGSNTNSVNIDSCTGSRESDNQPGLLSPANSYAAPIPFTQLTINEYEPGQGISAHIDTESCLGPDIAIICLASNATMVLQRRRSMSLLLRSAYPPLEAVPVVLSNSELCSRLGFRNTYESSDNESSCSEIDPKLADDGLIARELELNDKAAYNRFADIEVENETRSLSGSERDSAHGVGGGTECSEDGKQLAYIKKYVWLPRRSLLILRGEARYFWSHSITPRKFDKYNGKLEMRKRRVSLTFRQVMIPGPFPSCRIKMPLIESRFNPAPPLLDASQSNKLSFTNTLASDPNTDFLLRHGCITFDKVVLSDVNSFLDSQSIINCDIMRIPLLPNSLDSVHCIDALERISHLDRRCALIRELVRICRVGGEIVISAPAFEAVLDIASMKKQDVLVPYFPKPDLEKSSSNVEKSKKTIDDSAMQYLHLFKKDEIENMCSCVPGNRVQSSQLKADGRWSVVLLRVLDPRFEGCVHAPYSGMPTLARLD